MNRLKLIFLDLRIGGLTVSEAFSGERQAFYTMILRCKPGPQGVGFPAGFFQQDAFRRQHWTRTIRTVPVSHKQLIQLINQVTSVNRS
jgi:hypothetical protein